MRKLELREADFLCRAEELDSDRSISRTQVADSGYHPPARIPYRVSA